MSKFQIKAQEATVIGEKCDCGMKVLSFSEARGPFFHYDPPTSTSFGDQPLLGKIIHKLLPDNATSALYS
jgi:hypothetical protein